MTKGIPRNDWPLHIKQDSHRAFRSIPPLSFLPSVSGCADAFAAGRPANTLSRLVSYPEPLVHPASGQIVLSAHAFLGFHKAKRRVLIITIIANYLFMNFCHSFGSPSSLT